MARPRIAFPLRFSESASALRYRAEVAARALVEAVWAAGGEPIMLHPAAPEGVDTDVTERLRHIDGLLLPGGGDLAGKWSGQPDHETLYDVDLTQDAFDLALAKHALAVGLPTLAICRGLQVVNVLLGGQLVADMDSSGITHHRHRVHHVEVEPDEILTPITGSSVEVSCYHHQCLGDLAPGLRVVGRAEDGVPEAVRYDDAKAWFLGLQWHPEDTAADDPVQAGLFKAFIDACR
ncbi:MAG TPA: gamma-glutamyl-gamma-aminobutyrate hydrolase family protein [Marmoricola sp.]|nr:gamma-glutamyl-gamma-aminobutyrate hydrolase family protein [Marmoricola sp.]